MESIKNMWDFFQNQVLGMKWLNEFIKNGLLNAVGKMADYQVILNAAGWFEKGVLTEEDLAEIQMVIDTIRREVNEITEG